MSKPPRTVPTPPPPASALELEAIANRVWEKACRAGTAGPSDEPNSVMINLNDPWTLVMIQCLDGAVRLGASRRHYADSRNIRTGVALACRVAYGGGVAPGISVELLVDPAEVNVNPYTGVATRDPPPDADENTARAEREVEEALARLLDCHDTQRLDK